MCIRDSLYSQRMQRRWWLFGRDRSFHIHLRSRHRSLHFVKFAKKCIVQKTSFRRNAAVCSHVRLNVRTQRTGGQTLMWYITSTARWSWSTTMASVQRARSIYYRTQSSTANLCSSFCCPTFWLVLIPRLHNPANVEQTSSKHQAQAWWNPAPGSNVGLA